MMNHIVRLLTDLENNTGHFPPTEIYNEGWLLRLVMDWFYTHNEKEHVLQFLPESSWYSEALLPSAFLPRNRGDRLGESRTHADGVIGQFAIGREGKADFEIDSDAQQLLVLEAKMSSPFSKGTRNAPYFNQAARNVACIAEVFKRCNLKPGNTASVAFYVLAPDKKLEIGQFHKLLEHENIIATVQKRVDAYEGDRDEWFTGWFLPLMDVIDIQSISWESIIAFIQVHDTRAGNEFEAFYQNCLKYN